MKCSNCGDCCGDLNITEREYEIICQLKPEAAKKFEKILHMYYCFGPCPLRENGKCSIYKMRPNVCRAFPVIQGINMGPAKFKVTTFCPNYQTLTKHDIKIAVIHLRADLSKINLAGFKYTQEELMTMLARIDKVEKKKPGTKQIDLDIFMKTLEDK